MSTLYIQALLKMSSFSTIIGYIHFNHFLFTLILYWKNLLQKQKKMEKKAISIGYVLNFWYSFINNQLTRTDFEAPYAHRVSGNRRENRN